MKLLTHINIPMDAMIELMEGYEMSHSDIQKAISAYVEYVLNSWDDGVMTFFKFVEDDYKFDRLYTNN